MPGPEVLARCIAAIEQGATVEECLSRYPADAKELEPHLRFVAQLRRDPPPQMSLAGFARGRAAVAAQARYQQRLQAPFLAAQTNHHPSPVPVAVPAHQVQAPAPTPPPLLPPWLRPISPLRWRPLLVTLILVMTLLTVGRNVNNSVPGSLLYPVKLTSEGMQGYLRAGAGQQAHWYARQVQRRLAELDQLARQGVVDTDLVAIVDRQVQQALDASAALPAAERQRFFETWLADLRAVHRSADADATTVATLGRVIARVEAAATMPMEPTVLLPDEIVTGEEDVTTTATPPAPVTAPSSVTAGSTPFASPVVLPTVTPTEFPLLPPPTSTSTPAPTVAPSPTRLPPSPAPVVIEDEAGTQSDDEPHQSGQQQVAPSPTHTPVQSTFTPTDVSTPTWTPVTGTVTMPVTVTVTVTRTVTPTATVTGTVPSPSPTITTTATVTASVTATASATLTPTEGLPPTVTLTPTAIPSGDSETPTPTVPPGTPTATLSPTARTEFPSPTSEATPTLATTPVPETPTEAPTPEATPTVAGPGEEPAPPTETPTPSLPD